MGKVKPYTSKRQTLKVKYKIKKKVAEHNRKLRRQAKKNPNNPFKRKKNNEIPTYWACRDELLEQKAEFKERERQHMNKVKAYSRRLKLAEESAPKPPPLPSNVNLISRQTYFAYFRHNLGRSDVIVQVVDARDPLGYRCQELEEMAKEFGKRVIVVLTKVDLIPAPLVSKWLDFLSKEVPTLIVMPSAETPNPALKKPAFGCDLLITALNRLRRSLKLNHSMVITFAGYPHVGKRAVMRSLREHCRVPMDQRVADECDLQAGLRMMNIPTVLFSGGFDPDNELRNCVDVGRLEDPTVAALSICRRVDTKGLLKFYKIATYKDPEGFLQNIARKHSYLDKEGEPRFELAAAMVVKDWLTARLVAASSPPTKPFHVVPEDAVVPVTEDDYALLRKRLLKIKLPDTVISRSALSPGDIDFDEGDDDSDSGMEGEENEGEEGEGDSEEGSGAEDDGGDDDDDDDDDDDEGSEEMDDE